MVTIPGSQAWVSQIKKSPTLYSGNDSWLPSASPSDLEESDVV